MSNTCVPKILQESVPLSLYSTWKVGGTARFLACCDSVEDIVQLLPFVRSQGLPLLVVGRGSNVLFSDAGYDGVVIIMTSKKLAHDGAVWRADAGVSFTRMGILSSRAGWSGLEFAAGIPASVGGAVFMNAGAHGCETRDTLEQVELLLPSGEVVREVVQREQFSYRHSPYQERQVLILSATFRLSCDHEAAERQRFWLQSRTESQPYDEPSAGCVFRNQKDHCAGALIDRCGLKGCRVGDAMVSLKHGNFIVNAGRATAAEITGLIELVQTRVFQETGVFLEKEVRLINSDDGWHAWK